MHWLHLVSKFDIGVDVKWSGIRGLDVKNSKQPQQNRDFMRFIHQECVASFLGTGSINDSSCAPLQPHTQAV